MVHYSKFFLGDTNEKNTFYGAILFFHTSSDDLYTGILSAAFIEQNAYLF